MVNQTFDGWLVLDKPHGMTSRAAVDLAARWFPKRHPLGHAGTLDPLATGVLVLAVGKATRLIEFVQRLEKTYETKFTFGATSATDDAEGPIAVTPGAVAPEHLALEAALRSFVGEIQQVPPAFSAVKVAGRRAYKHARQGHEVQLEAKPIQIHQLDCISYEYPTLSLVIRCGKGTYVRSLARDLGAKLGVGGYVSQLRRTAIGLFTTADATAFDAEAPLLLPLERGVEALPRWIVNGDDVNRLRVGQSITAMDCFALETEVACLTGDGGIVAIARAMSDRRLQPTKVLG